MKKILVIGASGNAGMSFIKSLKKGDLDLEIHGMDVSNYFFDNDFCDFNIFMPNMHDDEKIEFLNEYCFKNNIDFVHAQPDPEVRFLTFNQNKINFKIWKNSTSEYEAFENKLYCQEVWSKSLGLNFQCYSLKECEENPSLFEKILEQSGKVWVRAMKGAGSKGALPVNSLSHAIFWGEYWEKMRNVPKSDFMISEYLPGNEYAVQTLWYEGELISSQARQRVEYFFGSIMPSGQSSTPSVAKTVSDRAVYDVAYESIKSISNRPHGIYCVDLKSNKYGNIFPLEVNYGRFFTTSNFFTAIGINAPLQYLSLALGIKVNPTVEAIKDEIFWTRGLDREPYLAKEKEGKLMRISNL